MEGNMRDAPFAPVDVSPREVSLGRVFSRASAVIRSYPAQTLGLTYGLTVLPGIVLELLGVSIRAAWANETVQAGTYVAAGIGGLVAVLLWLVTTGALVAAVIDYADRRAPDVREMVRIGFVRGLPLLAVSILYWMAIWLGMIALIVPGVIVAVMLSMASCTIVAERPGVFGAFSRSRALTRGARWQVFGVFLVILVFYVLVGAVAGVVGLAAGAGNADGVPAGPSLIAQLVTGLVSGLVTTGAVAVWASLYVELRDWTDGPDGGDLADIFA